MVATSVLCVGLGLLTVLSPVFGIKCYECDSDEFNYDPADPCLDPFFNDGEVTGDVKAGVGTCENDVCVKAKGEISTASKYYLNSYSNYINIWALRISITYRIKFIVLFQIPQHFQFKSLLFVIMIIH